MYTPPGSEILCTLYPKECDCTPAVPLKQLSPGSAVYWAPVSCQCGCILVAVAGAFVLGLQMYPGDTALRAPQPGQGHYSAPVPLAMHMFLVSLYPSRAGTEYLHPGPKPTAPHQSAGTLVMASVCLCPGSAPMHLLSSRVAVP